MYDNTNKGTIAKNPRKESDRHPDIKGSLNVDGRDYWIDGWQKKNSRDGSTFYSLTVKPKDQARQQPKQSQVTQRPTSYDADDRQTHGGGFSADLDDEIPFAPEWR